MSEKFCLRWNDFHSNVSKSFSRLRNEDSFYDVTLVSDDQKQVPAHRLILSSCSEYFRNILKENKHTITLVCLDGLTFSDLNRVMDYIYHGEVNIYQEDLEKFLKISERLKLEGLRRGDFNFKSIQQADDKKLIYNDTYQIKQEIFPERKKSERGIHEKIDDNETFESHNQNNKIIIHSEEFTNIGELDARIMEYVEKTVDGKWMCNICKRKMKSRGHAKEHVETHIDGLSFPCQQCSFVAKSRHSFRDHIRKYSHVQS